ARTARTAAARRRGSPPGPGARGPFPPRMGRPPGAAGPADGLSIRAGRGRPGAARTAEQYGAAARLVAVAAGRTEGARRGGLLWPRVCGRHPAAAAVAAGLAVA